MVAKELSKGKENEIRLLHQKKQRDKKSLFIAEGSKSVADLIDTFLPAYIVGCRNWIENNVEIAERFKEKVFLAPGDTLKQISAFTTAPEVLAVFHKPEDPYILKELNPSDLYLALDDVQDPGNFGTIIRTCDWFGIYDLFASRGCADLYNPKVVQATMGSLKRVRVHYVDLEELLRMNIRMIKYGTFLEGKNLYKIKGGTGGLIIMGNEGNGISEKIKDLIDQPITIPPYNKENHAESLNVAIATAVVLSHFRNN